MASERPRFTPTTSLPSCTLLQMLCPFGKFSPGGTAIRTCTDCPPGSHCPTAGALLPTACPPGTYTNAAGEFACKTCNAGRYSDTPSSNTSLCTGPCSAGFYCPSSTAVTSPTFLACPPGTYSLSGAWRCLPCPAGRFGNTSAQSFASCSGVCNTPGRYCPAASTSASGVLCPAGTYSVSGATACAACPASAPHSPAGSTSSAACVACTASTCVNGEYGAYPCPDATWTAWVNVGGVEASHSCIKALPNAVNWTVANATCAGLGPSYHLLTTRQVCLGELELDRPFPLFASHLLVPLLGFSLAPSHPLSHSLSPSHSHSLSLSLCYRRPE